MYHSPLSNDVPRLGPSSFELLSSFSFLRVSSHGVHFTLMLRRVFSLGGIVSFSSTMAAAALPSSFFGLSATTLEGGAMDFSSIQGNVVLVVNVASR